jgi:colicin import membrane protein
MNELVKINASDYGLDESKGEEIKQGLSSIIAEREILKQEYEKCIILEITPENIPLFKDLRLRIRDNRTKGIEVWHKNNKAYFLAGGQFVDAIRRKESGENEYMEEKLLAGEKFLENQEFERIKNLRLARVELLKPYTDIEPLALGSMQQEVFDNYLAGVKLAYDQKIAAERKAEEDRIAAAKIEADRIEAQRIENIKLKEDAAEKERLAEIERKKNAKILADQKAKADKERADLLAKAEAERKEKERLEKEIADKKAADDKVKRDAELKLQAEEKARKAEEKRAKLAPDKTKLLNFMQAINELPRPEVKSIEAADIASKANIMLVQCTNYIRDNANKL